MTRLVDLTAEDARRAAPWLAVPVGSCEQHGPHLPLGTDSIIADVLCEHLAQRVPNVVVAPAITVSASGEHAGFAGTLSIGVDVTADVLLEYVRSADWAGGVILVNGHGGNRAAIGRAVATATAEGRRLHAWWPVVAHGDAHAGHTETSLLLAIRPELVRRHLAEPGERRPLVAIARELRDGGVRAVSANGVLGDPTTATLDAGTRLLDRLVDDLVSSVTGVVTGTDHDDPPIQPRDIGPPARSV